MLLSNYFKESSQRGFLLHNDYKIQLRRNSEDSVINCTMGYLKYWEF